MLRPVVKILLSLMLASVMLGFCYAHYKASNEYEVLPPIHDRLRAGEALETVLAEYYSSDEVRTWEEFRYDNIQRNKYMFANGRQPQPGDLICIEVRKKIKK